MDKDIGIWGTPLILTEDLTFNMNAVANLNISEDADVALMVVYTSDSLARFKIVQMDLVTAIVTFVADFDIYNTGTYDLYDLTYVQYHNVAENKLYIMGNNDKSGLPALSMIEIDLLDYSAIEYNNTLNALAYSMYANVHTSVNMFPDGDGFIIAGSIFISTNALYEDVVLRYSKTTKDFSIISAGIDAPRYMNVGGQTSLLCGYIYRTAMMSIDMTNGVPSYNEEVHKINLATGEVETDRCIYAQDGIDDKYNIFMSSPDSNYTYSFEFNFSTGESLALTDTYKIIT